MNDVNWDEAVVDNSGTERQLPAIADFRRSPVSRLPPAPFGQSADWQVSVSSKAKPTSTTLGNRGIVAQIGRQVDEAADTAYGLAFAHLLERRAYQSHAFPSWVSVSATGHTIGIKIDYASCKTADTSSATEASRTLALLPTCQPADWSAETLDPSLVAHEAVVFDFRLHFILGLQTCSTIERNWRAGLRRLQIGSLGNPRKQTLDRDTLTLPQRTKPTRRVSIRLP
jgi:hypothetical protein